MIRGERWYSRKTNPPLIQMYALASERDLKSAFRHRFLCHPVLRQNVWDVHYAWDSIRRLNACLLSANVTESLAVAFYISKSSDGWAKGSRSSSFNISIIFRSLWPTHLPSARFMKSFFSHLWNVFIDHHWHEEARDLGVETKCLKRLYCWKNVKRQPGPMRRNSAK